ncbi:HDIG domain-containing metalloprotein [Frisingicoccus sp.]|uniref:HDIG domain-containing metalloprotein n=1 Tax=Frisingicoccus sp. TaxID=1918627 RepID=UPI0025BB42E1|nr:HDIG domain-containing metalloprotein [Frisingicoccus sp.]
MIRDKAINVLKKHDRLYVWLMENGYFDAPAAKSHHGAYKGGLFDHSLAVAAELQNLTDKLGLKWEREESPYLIGLLHDVCKMEDYIYSDDDKIEWNNHAMYSGHGDKSLIMLMGLIELTEEEKLCIRYHMGAFVDQKEWSYYSRAVNICPNVLFTHTADMIASQINGE